MIDFLKPHVLFNEINMFLLIRVPCQDVRFHQLLILLDPSIKDWERAHTLLDSGNSSISSEHL